MDTLFFVGLGLFVVVMLVLLVVSLVWVHRDATRRGHQNAGLITFLCFLCNWPFSFILYAALRNKEGDTTL